MMIVNVFVNTQMFNRMLMDLSLNVSVSKTYSLNFSCVKHKKKSCIATIVFFLGKVTHERGKNFLGKSDTQEREKVAQ